jgi:hypothetical protein
VFRLAIPGWSSCATSCTCRSSTSWRFSTSSPCTELAELQERMGRLLGEAFGGGPIPGLAAERSG